MQWKLCILNNKQTVHYKTISIYYFEKACCICVLFLFWRPITHDMSASVSLMCATTPSEKACLSYRYMDWPWDKIYTGTQLAWNSLCNPGCPGYNSSSIECRYYRYEPAYQNYYRFFFADTSKQVVNIVCRIFVQICTHFSQFIIKVNIN